MLEDIKKDAAHAWRKCVQTFPGRPQEAAHRPRASQPRSRTSRSTTTARTCRCNRWRTSPSRRRARSSVSPWEKAMVQAIEKAIHKSDLGLNADDRRHRHPHSACRRSPRSAAATSPRWCAQDAENARVAVRNVRRDVMTDIKEALKEKLIAQDDERRARRRHPEAHRQARRRHRSRCWRRRKRRSCRSERADACSITRCIAATCRDHHGRQRPLGRGARHCRAMPATGPASTSGAHVHRGMRAPRCRGAHAVRLLERELATARRRGRQCSWACSSTRSTARSRDLHQQQGAPALHRRPAQPARASCRRAWRRAEAADRGQSGPQAAGRRGLRRPLGHRAGRAQARGGSAPAAHCACDDIDEERFARALAARRACRTRICSSAPAASSASAISCCGISPTPSCTSSTRCGRISTRRSWRRRSTFFARARAALRPHARPAGRRGTPLMAERHAKNAVVTAVVLRRGAAGRRALAAAGVHGARAHLVVLVGAWEWAAFLRATAGVAALAVCGCRCRAAAACVWLYTRSADGLDRRAR